MFGQLEYFIQLEKQKEGGADGEWGWGSVTQQGRFWRLPLCPSLASWGLSSRTFSMKSLEPCIMNPCVLAQ